MNKKQRKIFENYCNSSNVTLRNVYDSYSQRKKQVYATLGGKII